MFNIKDLIRPDLKNFKSYSSARDEAKNGKIWLNANELPWCMDEDEALRLNRYPDKQPAELTQKLSELYQVQPEQLAFFRGSDEAIDLLARLFCQAQKDAILICPPTFGMYTICAQLQGAKVIEAPLTQDFQLDLAAIKQAWTPAVKIIFICSPNNPSGNVIPMEDIKNLCQSYLGKSIIVVDEAYIEFAEAASASTCVDEFSNLAILRTLSKAYGLAGARFGVLLAQAELINWVKNIMAPYPMSVLTVHAVNKLLAPARLTKAKQNIAEIKSERTHLQKALTGLPIIKKIWDSEANFLLIEVSDAEKVMHQCLNAGIVLRNMHGKPTLDHCLRISIGTPDENNAVIEILKTIE